LLPQFELDAEMNGHLDLTKPGSSESVLNTEIECPAPQHHSLADQALGTFYDFCHYAKMCSECGKMAGEEEKMHMCQGCKTEHYCNRVCQKAHWAKQHKGECKILFASQEQQNLGHLCCQIASCMFVWGPMHSEADTTMQNICR